MSPPAPVLPPADIGLWTDEELFKSLEKITNGSPVPANVIADVNPYHYMPSNLPGGIWYLIRSEEKKDAELGFWKAKGEACAIFRNSAITGLRTTLNFYEGQAPHGRRTDWVMQEYRITLKGLHDNSKPKDSKSLCRVFLSDGQNPGPEKPPNNGGADIDARNHFHSAVSAGPYTNSITGQGSTSESQEKNMANETGPVAVAVAERFPDPPIEVLPDLDYISTGDYLELDDLLVPVSPCSSSDNSSCLSLTSDACFDSLALLQDLEDEKQEEQGKDASLKYSITTSVIPNDVVMHPSALGSLSSGNGSTLSAKQTKIFDYSLHGLAMKRKFGDGGEVLEHGIKKQNGNQGTLNSPDKAASSSSHKALSGGEKKGHVGRMKRLKKYLCFMPF